MLSGPQWVARRAGSAPALLAAAWATTLLAAVLVAGGLVLVDWVSRAGLARALDTAGTQAGVEVSRSGRLAGVLQDDAPVRASLTHGLPAGALQVSALLLSDAYDAPGRPRAAGIPIVSVADREGLPDHTRLVRGAWGGPSPAPLEVALPETTARELGVDPGSTWELRSRSCPTCPPLEVRVTGTFEPLNPAEAYWWGEDVGRAQASGGFTTYGPLVASPGAFRAALAGASVRARWRALPQVAALTPSSLSTLHDRISALAGGSGVDGRPEVRTALPELLDGLSRSLVVARSAVLVPVLQLVLLVGATLLLAARLLAERRRAELRVLAGRGASPARLAGTAAAEALLPAVAVALAAPPLAVLGVRAVLARGPLTGTAEALPPAVPLGARLAAALVAGVAALVLVLSTVLGGRGAPDRPRARAGVRRLGVDVAVLGLAALAYAQLRSYGGTVSSGPGRALGVDPALVAAPAVTLIAGVVLVVRLLPALAGAFVRWSSSRPGLVPLLGAWQVARRRTRYAVPAFLLVLALGIGAFATAYAATWRQAEQDLADHRAGAGVRVAMTRLLEEPPFGRADALAALPGVTAATAVARDAVGTGRRGDEVQVLALDAVAGPAVSLVRADLSAPSWPEALARLAAARPAATGAPLPAGRSLTVALAVRDDARERRRFSVRAIVLDDAGELVRLRLAPAARGQYATAVAPGGGRRLVCLEIVLLRHVSEKPARLRAAVSSVLVDGRPVDLPATAWRATTSRTTSEPTDRLEVADEEVRGARYTVTVTDRTLMGGTTGMVTLWPGGVPTIGRLAAVAGPGALPPPPPGGAPPAVVPDPHAGAVPVDVVGRLTAVPAAPGPRPTVVVDAVTYALLRYRATGEVVQPREWWLAVEPGAGPAVAQDIRASSGPREEVVARDELVTRARGEPLGGSGVRASLGLVLAAVVLVTLVGFVLAASGALRERQQEFAVLRALGVTPGQLRAALALEHVLLVGVATVSGALLGLAFARPVLPLLLLDTDGSRLVPLPLVRTDPAAVAALGAGALGALALASLVAAALSRRAGWAGLGGSLRFGESPP